MSGHKAVEEANLADGAGQRTLAEKIYDALVREIVDGVLEPGAKINEPELARRFGTSRGPLREAIGRLEARRLVTRTAHVGARVVRISQEVLVEMFMFREALEGMAARLAAIRMDDREIRELDELQAAHESSFNDASVYEYQRAHNLDFHYRIAVGARSPMIEEVLCKDLYQLLRLYRYQNKMTSGRGTRALVEHRRILEALKDRDADLAEALMRRHVATARSVLQMALEKAEGKAGEVPDLAKNCEQSRIWRR